MTTCQFDFEWDPAKAKANLKKHGVSFERAAPRSDQIPEGLRDPSMTSVEAHWVVDARK